MAQKMMGGSMWVVGFLVLGLFVSLTDAMSCQQAEARLSPCMSFLTGAGSITVPCCDGANMLNGEITSKVDRQAVCECFKKIAPSLGVKVDRANELLKDCSINVGLPISPDVDCSRVS